MVHRQALVQVPLPAHPAARLSSGLPLLRAPREAGVMQPPSCLKKNNYEQDFFRAYYTIFVLKIKA
jgi:hypothetical protein